MPRLISSVSGQDIDIRPFTGQKVNMQGTPTNNNATAGDVGEEIESRIPAASAVSLTTGIAANVTSIQLTGGDWDVWGNVTFIPGATTNVVQARGWISQASVTLPDPSLYTGLQNVVAGLVPADNFGFCVPGFRVSVSSGASPVTVYLSARASFTVSTLTVCGGIYARRRR